MKDAYEIKLFVILMEHVKLFSTLYRT